MSAFSRLSSLAEEGSITLIELHAVPRSLSTALGRCLNESRAASVFLDEPFRRVPEGATADSVDPAPATATDAWSHDNAEIAARHVMRSAEPLLSATNEPVIVLTKNLARYLSAPVFRTWTDICSAIVWCIRDPRVQVSSLVTRTANDLLFGIGTDRLQQADLQPSHLAMVTEFLQNSQWSTNFSKTGWQAIGAHFTDCVGRLPGFVADGSLLSRFPDRLLRYLCAGLGIEFSDRMVDGWAAPFVNVDRLYDPDLTDSSNAWVKHAATSRGVESSGRPPLELALLPAALRDHLRQVAVPTYDMLMRAFYVQENLVDYQLDRANCPAG